jgi:hypothetical protein
MDASTICLRSLAQECNHRSGIFGNAVSKFLRESDLTLKEACFNSREFLPRGGLAVLAPSMAARYKFVVFMLFAPYYTIVSVVNGASTNHSDWSSWCDVWNQPNL